MTNGRRSSRARKKIAGKTSIAGDEIDRLQRAEIAVDHRAHDAAEGDVDGEAGRMRVVRGDVVRAHAEAEERLVPIPERARHRQKARGRADERDDAERQALARRERG